MKTILPFLLLFVFSCTPDKSQKHNSAGSDTIQLLPEEFIGKLEKTNGTDYFSENTWYKAQEKGDGLIYRFPKGLLADYNYLSFDLLFEGLHMAKHTFHLRLIEEGGSPVFYYTYGLLPSVTARLRIPLEAVNQNRLFFTREGGLIKPSARGDRVDLSKVDRMEILVIRIGEPISPLRWCQTPVNVSVSEPPILENPSYPKGVLIDSLGQFTLHSFANKLSSNEDSRNHLLVQLRESENSTLPENYSKWGGWKNIKFNSTGFFRTQFDGKRWWLVDPDGYGYWSSGINCVGEPPPSPVDYLEKAYAWLPEKTGEYADAWDGIYYHRENSINFLIANFIRAFGAESWRDNWDKIAMGSLKKAGFNSFGNSSDWDLAERNQFPYTKRIRISLDNTPSIFRDFPDVYHPNFRKDVIQSVQELAVTANSKAMIGYFIQNEATWARSSLNMTPAEGMLYNTETCYTREELAEFLKSKYNNQTIFSEAWKTDKTFEDITTGIWTEKLSEQARQDLKDFSILLADYLYSTITSECKKVDKNHINLGTRFAGTPKEWALKSMKYMDVISFNVYSRKVGDKYGKIAENLDKPLLIGEWHFGALDAGLPGLANQQVRTQEERGKAFRVYQEWAAAQTYCVGSHYYRFYDNPAMGRNDGENYNIGFYNVCHKGYQPLIEAARETHERLYEVVSGEIEPYDQEPHYLGL